MAELAPFVLLRDPSTYVPCRLDLVADADVRKYWVDFFTSHIDTITSIGVAAQGDTEDAKHRGSLVARDLRQKLRDFSDSPTDFGPVTLFTLDRWRDDALRRHGFENALVDQKRRENDKMLPLLEQVIAEIEASDDPVRLAIEGVFAGNIFDMGAKATAGQFKDSSPDFLQTRGQLTPRPWLFDDLDAFANKVNATPPKKTVFFADNAGSDFVLGVLPFVWLASTPGSTVVLAANEEPSLNDMTAAEIRELWPRLPSVVRDLPVEIVSTGTGDPLIDLSAVSQELNDAASGADLVVLEGMGRGVESNFDADLTCDRLNLAMLKDESIARSIGGELYDCVCRFVPA
ncbi:MAG: ARMT1-like domain-containing protein [Planctomycetota bacterium]